MPRPKNLPVSFRCFNSSPEVSAGARNHGVLLRTEGEAFVYQLVDRLPFTWELLKASSMLSADWAFSALRQFPSFD